jgi:hypothetical protein
MRPVVFRECAVLVIGFSLSILVSVSIGNGGRGPGNPIVATLLPIAMCLGRASCVKSPSPQISLLRRACHPFVITAALLVLLLFESAIGFLMGARNVPALVWLIVAAIGLVYVLLFCLAHLLASTGRSPYTQSGLNFSSCQSC